ncbi:MAG: hypothetical protein ACI4CS_06280 [Candidatus Weimeria sp.]
MAYRYQANFLGWTAFLSSRAGDSVNPYSRRSGNRDAVPGKKEEICLISSVQIPSKEKDAIEDVKRYNLNNAALELDILSCRNQMKKVRKAIIEKEVYYGVIALVFIFFSVMSMICMILLLLLS